MNHQIAILSVIIFIFAGGHCSAQTTKDCYAFERNGSVVLRCQNTATVTPDLALKGFAISSDLRYIALERSVVTRRTASIAYANDESEVIDIENGRRRKLNVAASAFFSSCGKLLAYSMGAGTERIIREPLGGTILHRNPYTDFRCSTDENTIIGYVPKKQSIMTGFPAATPLAPTGPGSQRLFNVSLDGKYIAYFIDGKLCLLGATRQGLCTSANLVDSLDISNSGTAIFAMGTGKECFYKDQWHFSSTRKPGYKGRDECIGIGIWNADMKEPQLIETFGRHPQWIQGNVESLTKRLQQLGKKEKGDKEKGDIMN